MRSITFEHRYLLRRTFPIIPLSLPARTVSLSLSLFLSFSISLFPVFSPSRSNTLPIGNKHPDSCLSLFLSLYTKCTLEAKFKGHHATTFSYTSVHLEGPAGHDGHDATRYLHHPSSSSARRVSRFSSLSLSLTPFLFPFPSLAFLRAHFSSLSFALSLAVALVLAARPSSPDSEKKIGATEELAGREIEI